MRRFAAVSFLLFVAGAAAYLSRSDSGKTLPIRTGRATPPPGSAPDTSPRPKTVHSPHSREWTAVEREKVLDEMADVKREHDAWYDRATLFERELTRADIARITEGYPDSFFRRVGVFTTQNAFRGKCARPDYESLKRTMGLETLNERAIPISLLVQFYDERYLSDYFRKIRASWSVDSRWKEFRDLDRYYAEIDALHSATKRTDAEYAERISAFERKLVESGVPPAEVTGYALRTAASHPNCLGPLAVSDLLRWLKRDLTEERGKVLLERLRKYWSRERRLPKDLSILLSSEDRKRRRFEDAWDNDFRVKEENALEFGFYSDGPDRNSGTQDDIRIGTLAK